MLSPNYPVSCCPLPYVTPVFVHIVSPLLGWSPLSSVRVMVSKWWHVMSIGRLWGGWYAQPRTISFFLLCWLYCPLPDPDVGLSIFECDVEHTSFHFGLCGRKFVLCLFGQCPGLCTICHSWQHTWVTVVHLSLQADVKVAFDKV